MSRYRGKVPEQAKYMMKFAAKKKLISCSIYSQSKNMINYKTQ